MANHRRGPARVQIPPEVKQRWYQRGVYALAKTAPLAAQLGYGCPLCIRAAPDVNLFTAEDVPLRRVGGKPLVLTCAECNNRAGMLIDLHWGHLADVEAFMYGELTESLNVQLRQGHYRLAVDLTRIEDTVVMVGPEGNSGFRLSTDEPVKLTFPNRFRYGRAKVSILRASYLAAFSVLGYMPLKYWRRIREQIQQPRVIDREVINLVRHEHRQPVDRRVVGHVAMDNGTTAVYVGLGRWTTLLPLAPESKLYGHPPADGWNFAGTGMIIPPEPTFGLSEEEIAEAEGVSGAGESPVV